MVFGQDSPTVKSVSLERKSKKGERWKNGGAELPTSGAGRLRFRESHRVGVDACVVFGGDIGGRAFGEDSAFFQPDGAGAHASDGFGVMRDENDGAVAGEFFLKGLFGFVFKHLVAHAQHFVNE